MRSLFEQPAEKLRFAVAVVLSAACAAAVSPAAASAFNPVKPICKAAGMFSGAAGKACDVVQNPGRVIGAGKKLLSGHPAQAVKTALGDGASAVASKASVAIVLAGLVTWVTGGAKFALQETATLLGKTTDPQLQTTWFSSTYWRVAGIAAVLTLPFLFAAAIQALLRSDLALLARATLGYLPLAMLAVGVVAPLTMLLLSASDQVSELVSSAAGNASAHFLSVANKFVTGLTFISGSPFVAFFVGLFTVAGAMVLWIELLIREAAVYVIVLMMPLAFAAFVWPARRVWAIRAMELLVALIISKFAIVAVLSLGGEALNSPTVGGSITSALAGLVLLALGALTPWALLRLLPLAELAGGATGSLYQELRTFTKAHGIVHGLASAGEEWAASITSSMRRDAAGASEAAVGDHRGLESDDGSNRSPGGAAAELERLGALASSRQIELQANGESAPEGQTESAPATQSAAAAQPAEAGQNGTAPHTAADQEAVRISAEGESPLDRLADLHPIWGKPNWKPMTMGLDQGWPPKIEAEDDERPSGPSDDPDPTPEAQEPQEGRL